MTVIDTKNAPGAIGPYSQAYEANGFVFTSGQLPVNPADGSMPAGIAAQAEQSCKNVLAILEAAGSGADKVIKTTCFLADIADFCRLQRGVRQVFHLQARPLLLRREGSAQGRPVRDRGHRRQVISPMNHAKAAESSPRPLSVLHKKRLGFFPPGFAFPLASPAQKVYSLVSRKYISAKNFL